MYRKYTFLELPTVLIAWWNRFSTRQKQTQLDQSSRSGTADRFQVCMFFFFFFPKNSRKVCFHEF